MNETAIEWHRAAHLDDLVEEEPHPVEIGNTFIALVKCGDEVHAVGNICTHEFALLSDGIVEGGCIECPLHQARFDVATGEHRGGPACEPIRIYRTRVGADGSVLVQCE